MRQARRLITYMVAFALAFSGAVPLAAAAEEGTPGTAAGTASDLLADGTYRFESFTSSTGMVSVDNIDGPARAVVDGDAVVLVLDVYNPDKYDGLWLGKRSEAPVDPYGADVTAATMVEADGFAGNTNTWIDAGGLVGEAGLEYKASRFIMYLTRDEFVAMLADEGRLYFAIRRAAWSPSNAGKWMGSADNHLTLSEMRWESASTEVAGEQAYADGTYVFDRFASSTGMVTPNGEDGPATAVIRRGRVALVLDIYNPDKYDGLWAGRRADAPVDPYDGSVVSAEMLPADGFSGDTNTWIDAEGLVGEAGLEYKAARFVMTMGKREFIAMVEDGLDEDFHFAIRRAAWSPSNAGKWMGSGDHYFTFGGLSKVSRSTYVPGGFPEGGDGETAFARVKRLIDGLPYDPYGITLEDAGAIREAEDAYAGLPLLDQMQLDVQDAANGVLTYGRTLECASWGLRSLAPVDDSTTLRDGTYTTQVTSTCEMGKSNSRRGYKFTVVKVTVKDGRATATLEHETASPDTVRTGGKTYAHANVDERARSRFEVPIDLNSTFHLSQMAKNPTSNTIAIPYEMMTEVDEANAAPDPEEPAPEADPAPDPAPDPTPGPEPSPDPAPVLAPALVPDPESDPAPEPESKPGSSPKTAPSKEADGAGSESAGKRARGLGEAAPAPVVVVTRRTGGAGAAGGRAAGGAEPAPEAVGAARSLRRAPTAPSGGPAPAPDGEAFEFAPYVAAGAAGLAILGAGVFVLDYARRDRRPVRVRGVRLSGKRG